MYTKEQLEKAIRFIEENNPLARHSGVTGVEVEVAEDSPYFDDDEDTTVWAKVTWYYDMDQHSETDYGAGRDVSEIEQFIN